MSRLHGSQLHMLVNILIGQRGSFFFAPLTLAMYHTPQKSARDKHTESLNTSAQIHPAPHVHKASTKPGQIHHLTHTRLTPHTAPFPLTLGVVGDTPPVLPPFPLSQQPPVPLPLLPPRRWERGPDGWERCDAVIPRWRCDLTPTPEKLPAEPEGEMPCEPLRFSDLAGAQGGSGQRG